MIRILIADDSATQRALLQQMVAADPELHIAGFATDGWQAVAAVRALRPDVVVMDIIMPGLDGLSATKRIMCELPTPIIIISSLERLQQVPQTMEALRAGAVAAISKPAGPASPDYEHLRAELCSTIRALAGVKLKAHAFPLQEGQGPRAGVARVVALAASTGGPAALSTLLGQLPPGFPPPILIVQHISRGFTPGFVDWLSRFSQNQVKLARHQEKLVDATVYVAPEDFHLGVTAGRIELSSAAPLSGFRPSADYLFTSVAAAYGRAAIGVILTGMGEDGVIGLRALKDAGGLILAQDEQTSTVFGMPAAAAASNLPSAVLPLPLIAQRLEEALTDGGS